MSGSQSTTPQHALSIVTGVREDIAEQRLRRVIWAAPKGDDGGVIGAPGLHDLGGTQRTGLVNDLARYGIDVEIRLRSLAVLREVTRDPEATELRVVGPTAGSTVAEQARMTTYTITTAWQSYPVAFANWLDYQRSEQRTLGAAQTIRRRVKEIADGGEVVHRWKNIPVRPVDLFEFRMAADTMLVSARDVPLQQQAREWEERDELAKTRAEMSELRRLVASFMEAPPIVEDTPDDGRVAMPGGPYLDVSDEAAPVGGDDDDEYGDEPVSPTVLAQVAAATGGGTVKGGRRK